jgi:hypothetical protein
MLFVQATTGGGGWPMSVCLTPELEPFFGGTYSRPTARARMLGLLPAVAGLEQEPADQRRRSAGGAIRSTARPTAPDAELPDRAALPIAGRRSRGFGRAQVPRLSTNFLLRYGAGRTMEGARHGTPSRDERAASTTTRARLPSLRH